MNRPIQTRWWHLLGDNLIRPIWIGSPEQAGDEWNEDPVFENEDSKTEWEDEKPQGDLGQDEVWEELETLELPSSGAGRREDE